MYTLEAKHISKTFSAHRALNDVSIHVPSQSVFGLLGPNGAGKTTLIRIINQITGPDSGEVFFEGEKLSAKHVEHIGYLPEERGLYRKMKVGEQCMYLAQLKGLRKPEAKARLMEWFKRFDIHTWWDKKVEDLSKGMAQKIQFITTVLHKPRLLILDEPFSGFDPINAELIRNEMLRMKNEGTTIILSTHDMGSVEALCDNIALINRAQVILDGSVKDIKNSFRTMTYEVEYEGTAMDLGIGLGPFFELLKSYRDNDRQIAQVKISANHSLNDLLKAMMEYVQVISARELIPNMNDIFIEVVNRATAKEEAVGNVLPITIGTVAGSR
ncbi:MAG: ATP-binding cassette domain-containing protein [Flavobacteriales bacterium]|nr:ATP-binding cassette domain-containing protein [Flavobacteriales bacterium]